MTTTADTPGAHTDNTVAAIDELHDDIAAVDMHPMWLMQGLQPPTPRPRTQTHVWRWVDVEPLARRSGDLIDVDHGGDRRVLAMVNPGLDGAPATTSSLWAALQYLMPGEIAPAHRHSASALRFVLEGEGVWTLVDGDPIRMSPGDVVLTPAYAWHEHQNAGDKPMIWFDGLDLPVVRALDATFFDEGPETLSSTQTPHWSRSESSWSSPGIVPVEENQSWQLPLLVYRYADMDAALERHLTSAADGHATIRLTDPRSGADALPRLRVELHRLAAGGQTPLARRAGSSVWVVFDGTCTAEVDGVEHSLSTMDTIAVPSWSTLRLRADQRCTVFCLSDEPMMKALGLDRHETLTGEDTQ